MVNDCLKTLITVLFLVLAAACSGNKNEDNSANDIDGVENLRVTIADLQNRLQEIDASITLITQGTENIQEEEAVTDSIGNQLKKRDKDEVRLIKETNEIYNDSAKNVNLDLGLEDKKTILENAEASLQTLEQKLSSTEANLKSIKENIISDPQRLEQSALSAKKDIITETEEALADLKNDLLSAKDRLSYLRDTL